MPLEQFLRADLDKDCHDELVAILPQFAKVLDKAFRIVSYGVAVIIQYRIDELLYKEIQGGSVPPDDPSDALKRVQALHTALVGTNISELAKIFVKYKDATLAKNTEKILGEKLNNLLTKENLKTLARVVRRALTSVEGNHAAKCDDKLSSSERVLIKGLEDHTITRNNLTGLSFIILLLLF